MSGSFGVTLVNLVLWTGIFLYLLRLSRRVKDLEKGR